MSILIFAPLLYLLVGIIAGLTPFDIKGYASALLTKVVIPLVIIFNITAHRSGVFTIMVGMVAMMAVMLFVSCIQTRNPVQNLCFCYLNIVWFGLPIASTLFGNGAAMVMIAAYVGSSVFGNLLGVGLMAQGGIFERAFVGSFKHPQFGP